MTATAAAQLGHSQETLFAFYVAILGNDHVSLRALLIHPGQQRLVDSPIIRDRNGGFNALMLATSLGHLECIDHLITAGADVNYRVDGRTPLHWAIRNVCGLLRLLTDPRVILDAVDDSGHTALQRARGEKDLRASAEMIEAEVARRQRRLARARPLRLIV
ncbi:hypothetical protein IWQ60_009514 [Tieghemiomyces parasiticus]|uniref:protein S-acyltransferase n=1 Tax=Tieghemiomyces parasiticus TaxID=78921 RepID=A0A9W7ZP36_9FUNG|nr:hypothetical protein IWQ60_009514 [Tieghemiomyces parasiticus]